MIAVSLDEVAMRDAALSGSPQLAVATCPHEYGRLVARIEKSIDEISANESCGTDDRDFHDYLTREHLSGSGIFSWHTAANRLDM